MFICRHQLLRAYGPRTTHSFFRVQRNLNGQAALISATNARPLSRTTLPDTSTGPTADAKLTYPSSAIRKPPALERHAVSSPSAFDTASWSTEKNDTQRRNNASMGEIQSASVSVTIPLAPEDLVSHIEQAAKRKQVPEVNALVERLVLHTEELADGEAVFLLREVLDILVGRNCIYRESISRILVALQTAQALDGISLTQLRHIVMSCLAKSPHPALDTPIFAVLTPILTDYVIGTRSDHRLIIPQLPTPRAVWTLFKMMIRLVHCRQHQDALQILRRLVGSGVIHESMLEGLDASDGSFSYIILVILLRACIMRRWRNRALDLLNSTIEWDKCLPASFGDIVGEVIDSLLEDKDHEDVRYAADLITRVMRVAHLSIPHTVLHRFYDAAHAVAGDTLVMDIYSLVRTVRAQHKYPPPSSSILYWLLQRCVERKNNHVMRLILSQVAEEKVELPALARPIFVKAAASHGLMAVARKLWRNAVEREDLVVIANSGILVRLVSLTQRRIRNRQQRLREGRQRETPLRVNSRGRSVSSSAPTTFRASDSSLATYSTTPDALSTDFAPPDLSEDYGDDHQNLSYQEQIDDYRAFADSVIETFVKYRKPLQRASHQDLNALGRAYILVGKPLDGIRAFRILLQRKELPDLRDANVALSSVSAVNPSGAARIIEQMVVLGLKPDAVTFGTVIHHAIEHGDMPLVTKLVARASQLNIEISYKTVGSLIRACVSNPDDRIAPRARLENAKHLIDSLLDAEIVPSAGMGLDCAVAALRADQPVMAYNFWTSVIRNKVQWDDDQQVTLRHRIGVNIRRHWKTGLVGAETARAMLAALEQPPHFPQDRSPHAVGSKKKKKKMWSQQSSDEEAIRTKTPEH